MERIRIATRRSRLALAQADAVASGLREFVSDLHVERVEITTRGDLSSASGQPPPDKGAFIDALESALLEGRADIAVHSMKDVPVTLRERFALATFGQRADARGALVVRGAAATLGELAPGARLGTSSLRRRAMLTALDRTLAIAPVRGNVDTRLRRLDDGDFDALVLACAGLARLGLEARIGQRIDPQVLTPAPGQGAITVEYLADRPELGRLLGQGTVQTVERCVAAERQLTRRLGADCSTPFGALCVSDGATLRLLAAVADPAGERLLRIQCAGADPLALGDDAARRLDALGVAELLAA